LQHAQHGIGAEAVPLRQVIDRLLAGRRKSPHPLTLLCVVRETERRDYTAFSRYWDTIIEISAAILRICGRAAANFPAVLSDSRPNSYKNVSGEAF